MVIIQQSKYVLLISDAGEKRLLTAHFFVAVNEATALISDFVLLGAKYQTYLLFTYYISQDVITQLVESSLLKG